MKKFITTESVTEGHPDKLADYISDNILDAYLREDINARVACETIVSKNKVLITGEITSNVKIDIEKITRNTIKEVGYISEDIGMNYKTCKVEILIAKQSTDIALGVDKSFEDKHGKNISSFGAGDQGIMFGYANNETEEFLPLGVVIANKLASRLAYVRKNNILKYLRPDGKVQVTVEYNEENTPVRLDTIVVSSQHEENVDIEIIRKDIINNVINYIVDKKLIDNMTKIYINPTGKFVVGGPMGDSGLTGRKIIVDTYGGYSKHGGGAFSGKDYTKVDRSAAYMTRHIAKNIVANGYADECEIQLAYAIGIANPISININTFGTNKISEEELYTKVLNTFNLTPSGIIEYLQLKKPIYSKTTNYGHFGKNEMTWEKIIKF